MIAAGQIVVLNGAPRSGKSSIVTVIQETFPGVWMNLGVDVHVRHITPPRYRPGIGLRPGGERPDLADHVPALYAALYGSIAAHSRAGLNVVVDVGHHAADPASNGVLTDCARRLEGLSVLFVGVRCPIDVIMQRRGAGQPGREGQYLTGSPGEPPPGPVRLWQREAHMPGVYDLEVDTSDLTPAQCADAIRARLDAGVPRPTAFERLAADARPGAEARSVDETEELIRLSARALVAQMSAAPGFELHMTRNCALGLTSEPLADFNVLILGVDPDSEGFLTRSVARAKARGLPLLATLSPLAGAGLAPVAARLGLKPVGTAPLMVLRGSAPVRPGRPAKVVRALGPDLVGIAGDLAAAAFDAPRDVIARCIDGGITETAGVETYIARGDDGAMSAVSVTPSGNTAAISLMATPPEHQRKGMGRALLSQVIDDFRRRGVARFHLTATEAGRPLYASLGFETIADLSAWVLESPTGEKG